jgi:hypothetical protein
MLLGVRFAFKTPQTLTHLNEDQPFSFKAHASSDFASWHLFVGFRLFAFVFGFCQRDDTRNVTRREGLRKLSCQRIVGDFMTSFGAGRLTRLVEPGRPSEGGSWA